MQSIECSVQYSGNARVTDERRATGSVVEGPKGNVKFFVERLIRRPSVRLEVVR